MKIAIPATKENTVDTHFGHCENYQIYAISENKEITGIQFLDAPCTCGCKSNIASTLQAMGVTVMLAGGIGQGAINVLNSAGIDVIRGCSGNIETLVNDYIKGNISDSGNTCGHNHSHGESCGH
jgi:predicted Fe-Mo cluster-binding NifX family protein